jgi:hypothetical protein
VNARYNESADGSRLVAIQGRAGAPLIHAGKQVAELAVRAVAAGIEGADQARVPRFRGRWAAGAEGPIAPGA